MKDPQDSTQRLLQELIGRAVNGARAGVPLLVETKRETRSDVRTGSAAPDERPAASALGLIQNLGGMWSGPVTSILNQAVPGKSATSWLRWLNPIAGVIGLFGGRKKEDELPAPVMAPRPAKRSLEYGLVASEGGVFRGMDTDEAGHARLTESGATVAAPSQVVVQVQAMDSRSFLDHRDEIASAVRQALMESHGLGSVLSEFQE